MATVNPAIDQSTRFEQVFYIDTGVGIFTIPTGSNPEGNILANAGSIAVDGNGVVFVKTTNGVATGWANRAPRIVTLAAQFNKNNDVALQNIPGLSWNLEAGRTYRFKFRGATALVAAGGEKWSMAYSGTAASAVYSILSFSTVPGLAISAVAGAIGGSAGNTGYGASNVIIEGSIVTTTAGALTVQFAQQVATVGNSSVSIDSAFEVEQSQ